MLSVMNTDNMDNSGPCSMNIKLLQKLFCTCTCTLLIITLNTWSTACISIMFKLHVSVCDYMYVCVCAMYTVNTNNFTKEQKTLIKQSANKLHVANFEVFCNNTVLVSRCQYCLCVYSIYIYMYVLCTCICISDNLHYLYFNFNSIMNCNLISLTSLMQPVSVTMCHYTCMCPLGDWDNKFLVHVHVHVHVCAP